MKYKVEVIIDPENNAVFYFDELGEKEVNAISICVEQGYIVKICGMIAD